ncbi:MAG: Trp biosynthesis-associated membrane protein [Nocardioidaceae bacterium]
MSDRPGRTLAAVVVGGLVTGGLTAWSATKTWASVEVSTAGMPHDVVSVSGSTATPLVASLGLVVMAGSAALLATSGRLRRALGVLIVVVALGAAIAAATAGDAVDAALSSAAERSASLPGALSSAQLAAADHPWWRWLSVLGALLSVAPGALAAGRGVAWPAMGRRFERDRSPAGGRADAPSVGRRHRPARAGVDDAIDVWKSLDEGHDPTQDTPSTDP